MSGISLLQVTTICKDASTLVLFFSFLLASKTRCAFVSILVDLTGMTKICCWTTGTFSHTMCLALVGSR